MGLNGDFIGNANSGAAMMQFFAPWPSKAGHGWGGLKVLVVFEREAPKFGEVDGEDFFLILAKVFKSRCCKIFNIFLFWVLISKTKKELGSKSKFFLFGNVWYVFPER